MINKRKHSFLGFYPFIVLLLSSFACSQSLTSELPVSTPTLSPTPFVPSGENVAPVQTAKTPLTDNPTDSSPSPNQTYQPLFKSAPCAFPVPSGYNPECGYLVVPENRALPNSALIQIHVAIFHSIAEGPAPDPVVHLAGGPGSSSLDVAGYLFNQGLGGILNRRDFIFFDQRGTGYSLPRLDCPERDAITPALLNGSLAEDEALQTTIDAFRRCRDRLVSQGIDLSTYNSETSAADINDLRLALRYNQLNLYGDSYGTRLALTLMRDFPQAVRSVVLDSTYPLEVNLYTSLASNTERAFNVLFDECAADPICNTSYPDLRQVFYNLVDQLNTSPARVPLSVGGTRYEVLLDGNRLIDVLFVGLYNPVVIASMPRMIYQIQQGEYSILRQRLSLYFDTSSALGMGISVQCAEEIPFNSVNDVYAAAQGVQPEIAAFFPKSVQYLFNICQDWIGNKPNPRENQPVTSDIPALILAGEFDPITPPVWGQMTASHLTHSNFFEFRGNGHWVTRSSNCALSIMLSFLDNPDAPATDCMQSPDSLRFLP
jgi:pimeloyl-ACP methyl ester carboxylesterase